MDRVKWILLLLQVWALSSAGIARRSGPEGEQHVANGDGVATPAVTPEVNDEVTSKDVPKVTPNVTPKEFPEMRTGDLGDPETDLQPWLQSMCRANLRRRCTDVMAANMETDYHANREQLRGIPEPYELVYPVQVRRNEQLPLDTRDHKSKGKNLHYHHTSFQLSMFGRRLKIRLDLNKDLLSAGLRQKRHVDHLTHMITEGPVEHCYYKGRVRKFPNSRVVVSTCEGVSGIIQLQNESYVIRPLSPVVANGTQARFPHVVYEAPTSGVSECANKRGKWHPFMDLHRGEFLKTTKILKTQQMDRDILTERKFLELVLVLDHTLYVKMNTTYSKALSYLLQMGNILDSYFDELGIQIQLIMVDIWNLRDLIPRTTNVRQALRDFMLYRQRSLNAIPHDLAHLISGSQFEAGESGMSVPDSVCSTRSVSVSLDPNVLDPQHAAAAATHYIGHALGLRHDDPDTCPCFDTNGCFMAHNILRLESSPPHHFSVCSQQAMNGSLLAGLGSCLFKKPLAMTYPQICGNKRLERGEECDCGSPEECAVNDPCCDPMSCLLRPWATCRSGACCHNCTVLPKGHVCRAPLTECDVPEVCDGDSGKCPSNDLVQDGQPCRHGSAFCYAGFCHTPADQCYALWGEGATQAVDRCYEKFNPTGSFNGHCGLDKTTGLHHKCQPANIKCGLLHCMGGDAEPRVTSKKTFTLTTVVTDGDTFHCKIVNSLSSKMPYLGLVEDGTRCGDASFCVNRTCVPIADVIKGTCPMGPNNVTCSGRGVCTSALRCFCERGYGGEACESHSNKTTTVWVRPTTPPIVISSPASPPSQPPNTVLFWPYATTRHPLSAVVAKEPAGVSTTWLIVVLAAVVGAAIVLFAASIICYRRQSPSKLKKAQKRKLFFNRIVPPVISSNKSDGSVASEDVPRLISFGHMPSYKADKMKAIRKSAASETASEHSTGSQREATELQVLHTLPLAKPPERGILKKYPRSTEDLLDMASTSQLAYFTDLHAEQQSLLRPIPMRDASTQGNTLEEGEYESLVSAQSGGESDSSLGKKDDLTPSDDDDSCFKPTPSPSPPNSGKEEYSHSDGGGGSGGSRHSANSQEEEDEPEAAEEARKRRMQNIEELIRKIDAQASTLAQCSRRGVPQRGGGRRESSLSPSSAEVEADRYYQQQQGGGGRGAFYQLSDCEEEERSPLSPQSPANGSPSHQYMPKPMPRLQRQYNPLQVEIPQNVSPFSILDNPPVMHHGHHSSNLSPASRRFPSTSSSLTTAATTPGSPRETYKPPPVAPLFSSSSRARTNSRGESPASSCSQQPQLSPGGLSTSSKLSTFSRLSNSSTPSSRAGEPLSAARRPSPPNPFAGNPYTMRRSPELNLGAIPLQPVPPLAQLGTLEKRRSPPSRTPERGSQSSLHNKRGESPLSALRGTPSQRASPDRKNRSPKPSPLPRSTPVKPRMPSPPTGEGRRSGSREASPAQSGKSSPESSGSGGHVRGSPKRSRNVAPPSGSPQPSADSQHPLTAIPYRGAKSVNSNSPTSLNRSTDSSSDAETPKTGSPKPPPRNPHLINKLTHPLLDGYPFKASHHSLTPDIASNSEGYHSDKTENEDSIIIREIPSARGEGAPRTTHKKGPKYKSGNSDSIDL